MKRSLLLILVTFMAFLLVACNRGIDYSDFPDSMFIKNVDQQLTQPYDVYYLYYYGDWCEACESIKEEALSMIELLKNDTLFFVEVNSTSDISEEIDVNYTPSLVKIVDNQVVKITWHTDNVIAALEALS